MPLATDLLRDCRRKPVMQHPPQVGVCRYRHSLHSPRLDQGKSQDGAEEHVCARQRHRVWEPRDGQHILVDQDDCCAQKYPQNHAPAVGKEAQICDPPVPRSHHNPLNQYQNSNCPCTHKHKQSGRDGGWRKMDAHGEDPYPYCTSNWIVKLPLLFPSCILTRPGSQQVAALHQGRQPAQSAHGCLTRSILAAAPLCSGAGLGKSNRAGYFRFRSFLCMVCCCWASPSRQSSKARPPANRNLTTGLLPSWPSALC